MKYIITILLSLSVASNGVAQKRPKYRDELPKILQLPDAGKVALLKVYRIEEPEEASIDLQLGVVYNNRFLNSDILTNYKYKYGNAIAALTSLKIARLRIDEKKVKRNEEQFFNFGSIDEKGRVDVEFDTITAYLDSSIPPLEEFIKRAPGIYDVFTQSFAHYDAAHKEFSSIVGQYTTEKDLLLLYDSDLDAKMEKVKSEYEESIKFFSQYKDSIAQFPIGYNQELVIKVMNVYRLDGLESEINFLTPKVKVWNYAKWVTDTREFIDVNIDKLKADLAAENLRTDKVIESATPDFIRDEFTPLEINKEVLFTLRKYDLASVIEPIFQYKEAKHDLLYQKLVSQNLDTSTTIDPDRKLYLYGQMLNKIKEADTLLREIQTRNVEKTHKKYNSFLTQYYSGMEGVNQLVQTERTANNGDYSLYVDNIRDIVFEKMIVDSTLTEVTYRRSKIPFIVSLPVDNEVISTEHITTHKINNFDGSAFIGGIVKNEKENKTQAFVAGVTKDGKTGWYRDYLLQIDSAGFDAHTRLAAMQTIPGGVALVLNGLNPETNDRINHLILLDETGEVTLSRRLLLQNYPRLMNYNERDNSLTIAYKGDDFMKDIFISNELIIANYNILGDLQWQYRNEYKGDITDIFNIQDGYMIAGNFNTIKGFDQKLITAGSNNTDTRGFMLKIDNNGRPISLKTLNSPRNYQIDAVYKVSDDCINILGNEGTYMPVTGFSATENSIHMILNNNLEILSSSIN